MILSNRPRITAHPEARREIVQTFRWHRERSERYALQLRHSLRESVEFIATATETWPHYLYGTRRKLLSEKMYSVVYREHRGVIQIIALVHARRRPGYWRDRLDD